MSTIAIDPKKTVRLNQLFTAPREKVFHAWTDPKELKKWWGREGYTTPVVEIDLREGGNYHFEMHTPEGKILHLTGSYIEVRRPERLAMTWSWEGLVRDDGSIALVTVEFVARGNQTEIVLTHERLPATSIEGHTAGWTGGFKRLAEYLAH